MSYGIRSYLSRRIPEGAPTPSREGIAWIVRSILNEQGRLMFSKEFRLKYLPEHSLAGWTWLRNARVHPTKILTYASKCYAPLPLTNISIDSDV